MQTVRTGATAALLFATAFTLLAPVASAQVGHMPDRSPYKDQKPGQTFSVMAGRISPREDPAGVHPRSGVAVGVRYDVGIGGPSSLFVRYFTLPGNRQLILPGETGDDRYGRETDATIHVADMGLDIALTGNKSWHSLIPSVTAGIGMANDFASVDSGGYKFGSKFSVAYGAALRIMPGGRLSYRLEATNYYWRYEYPDAYFVTSEDQGAIIANARNRGAWRFNWNLAAGVSWRIFK